MGREGTNALDAAFLAYSGISLMRQQMKPEQRVHGIIKGKDWSPNGTSSRSLKSLTRHELIIRPDRSDPRLCDDAMAGTGAQLRGSGCTRQEGDELHGVSTC